MLKHLNSLQNAVYDTLKALGTFVAIPLLIVLMGTDVFLRYVLNAPLPWGNEVSSLILLLIFFAGLPYCAKRNENLAMEIFYQRFPTPVKKLVNIINNGCGIVFASYLAWQGYINFEENIEYDDGAEFIDIPYWPFAFFIGLVGVSLFLHFLTALVNEFFPKTENY